jgi:hypothetical protein
MYVCMYVCMQAHMEGGAAGPFGPHPWSRGARIYSFDLKNIISKHGCVRISLN